MVGRQEFKAAVPDHPGQPVPSVLVFSAVEKLAYWRIVHGFCANIVA
jgi:hypothetical protein